MTGATWLLWIAVTLSACPQAASAERNDSAFDEPLTVFGAASLTDALSDIGEVFRASSTANYEVRFSFAASSTLARQIEAGAPAGIFASASSAWMDYLEGKALIESASRVSPIGNTLVLVAPADRSSEGVELNDLTILEQVLGPAGRIAMGDPAHVPAGMYAKQALQNLGWWSALESRTAFSNDVRAAAALVARGEAPLGIVYATDVATAKRLQILATFPTTSHDPIQYSFARVTNLSSGHSADDGSSTDAPAAALMEFLRSPPALEVFRQHGFLIR
jgi:molybdate transport system substrate-binding protein